MPARLLRLLSLLESRREWAGADLAERLAVTGRTVRRDIERLRGLGYPVDATTGIAGGYRLASGANLPPLVLDDDEAVAVAVGLRTAAGGVRGIEETSVRALAKLEQILPKRLRRQVATVGDATVALPGAARSGPQADSTTLAVLAAACRDDEVVAFDYGARDGTASARRVEPHSLVVAYGRWYLVAYDPDRAAWRTFRVDRMTSPAATGRAFVRRELPDADAAGYLRRTMNSAWYRYWAEATVAASSADVLAAMYAPIPGDVEPLDEHACVLRLGADSLDLLAHYLLGLLTLGAEFSLRGSPELRERLRTLGQRLTELGECSGQ